MTQSVKDALADAETLRRVAATLITPEAWAMSFTLAEAETNGAWAKHSDNAYLQARFVAAAAAFRACPELRG